MNINNFLVSCVNEALTATDAATRELARVKGFYQMTPEGVAEQRNRLFTAARERADAAKARGLAAIETRIAELDEQEKAVAARRATDTDYLNRLEQKLRLAAGLDVSDDELTVFFAEFEDDEIARAAIEKQFGGNRAFHFKPNSGKGQRQQHIRDNVRVLFEKTMMRVGCDPASFNTEPTARAAEAAAFVDYCALQDADFTRPDGEVWDEMRAKRTEDKAAPGFDLNMMALRK